MPACNGKPCTITRYYFNSFEVVSAASSDGGPALDDERARAALLQSESWRGKMVECGYDPARGTSAPLPDGVARYLHFTDSDTCAEGCTCRMNAPYTPTIVPGRMEQTFDYPGVPHGGKTYTVTIKASCILWDYPGTCRPNVVKTALSETPRHKYYALIHEGIEPVGPTKSKA